MPVKLRYFAWVREKLGRGDEMLDPSPDIVTVGDLVRHMARRGDAYAQVFSGDGVVRVAVDQVHADLSAPIAGAREIAFFPPVTGG